MRMLWWVLAGGGTLLALSAGGSAVYTHYKQRGIRNNNPGNLIKTRDAWLGKVPHSRNADPYFEKFENYNGKPAHLWGLRAMYIDLRGDVEKRGKNTVRKLISSYAPEYGNLNPSGALKKENETAAYIKAVAAALNKSADDPLSSADYPALMAAIVRVENGVQPYPLTDITKAMVMA